MKNHNDQSTLMKWSVGGIVLASACCWLPLVLILLGVINISTALVIGYNSTYFLAAGFGLAGLALFFYWRKRWKKVCTSRETLKKDLLMTILVIAAIIFITFFIKNTVLPFVAPYVYEYSLNR